MIETGTVQTDTTSAVEQGIISTTDLTKVYPGTDFKAVDELNLIVQPGEIFGLLGPNGAGKTTTAGMLTTRVIPTSGTASVAGIDVVAHPVLAKQLMGMVSQTNTLDRQLNVWENLYFHGRLFGIGAAESRRTADELFEKFQLSKFAKASVYALSGGMAQRLMVARSIFHRPAVLFMDEPTAGLDPQSRLPCGTSCASSTAKDRRSFSPPTTWKRLTSSVTRVAIMDHGKILALDTPEGSKQSVGADTIVTIKAPGDPEQLGGCCSQRERGRRDQQSAVIEGASSSTSEAGSACLPRIVTAAESGGFESSTSPSPSRAWRPSSSHSPERSCATDDRHRIRWTRPVHGATRSSRRRPARP